MADLPQKSIGLSINSSLGLGISTINSYSTQLDVDFIVQVANP